MTVTATREPVRESVTPVDRLLVTVQDAATRSYRPMGFLSRQDDEYTFAYFLSTLARGDFQPLPGLSRLPREPFRSASLFPVFAERVIAARRPDREHTLGILGLGVDAAPFEILARSQGRRVGDTIELLPAPRVGPGEPISFLFLTHGVRHLPSLNQDRISELLPGDPLNLRADPNNPVNPRAHVVTDTEDVKLGWVPDPLLPVLERVDSCRLSVEQANGPDAGFHLRLLARATGHLSQDGGALFDDPEWATTE